jgi:predicted permease
MSGLTSDLRYAVRSLRKNPGFLAVAVLILGLGIGANTAIFSVINGVLLRPLPYHRPDRLATVWHHYPSLNDLKAPVSVAGFYAYREQRDVFQQAAVEDGWVPTLTGRGEPARINAAQVTGDYFPMLGVAAAIGRGLRPDEAEAGHDKVVVVGHGFWQRVLGGEPTVIGQRLQLDGESYEIVGVMPPTFRDFWNRSTELWVPLVFQPGQNDPSQWTNEWLAFIGRLTDGVTVEDATARLAAYGQRLVADNPSEFGAGWGLVLQTLDDQATARIRPALLVLLGAVVCVLLIACGNVANLQLARAVGRAREVAVRVALGASPAALVRQLLAESMLLALAGGALGLAIAGWGVPVLLALNENNLPPASDLRLDSRVLGFTLLLALVTGLIFGLVPAIRVARTSVHDTLKEGGRGAAGDRGGLALRRGLVVATVSLALMLLVGAGLLLRSFGRLIGVDPGFQPERVLTFNVTLPRTTYPSDTTRIALWERLAPELAAVPGVRAAGGTSVLPFSNNWSTSSFNVEGYQPPANAPGPWGDIRIVTPGFLPALAVPLLKGRQFGDGDGPNAPQVVIVDEEMMQRYWPREDPIGKRITFNNPTDSAVQWIQVVGVVGHTMHEGLDGQRRVQLYFPFRQVGVRSMSFALRTAGPPEAVLGPVRAAVHRVDADLAIARVSSMEALISETTGPRRFSMILLGLFAGLAALLAALGLYGVMAYTVTQRSKELGVRLALGAGASSVLRLVVGQGMRLALLGVGIGLVAAIAASRVLQSMLFNVSAIDPITYLLIPLLLLLVTLAATWLPAQRAARVDPAVVLREE